MSSKTPSGPIEGATVAPIPSLPSVVDKSVYSSNNSVSHVLFLFFSVNLEHSLRFSLKPASIQTNRLKV